MTLLDQYNDAVSRRNALSRELDERGHEMPFMEWDRKALQFAKVSAEASRLFVKVRHERSKAAYRASLT